MMNFSYWEVTKVNGVTRVGGYVRAYLALTCEEGYLLPFEAMSDYCPYMTMSND